MSEIDSSVTRFLDEIGVEYVVKSHEQPAFTCDDAARERGMRVSQIVKTMVGQDANGGIHVALIPGDRQLKLKKLRQLAGGIRIDLADPSILEETFELVVGAISPTQLMGKAKFYMDETVLHEDEVDISSGLLEAGVALASKDLRDAIDPVLGDIVSSS